MARFRGNVSVHRHEAYVAIILMRGLLSRQLYLASVGVSPAARGMRQKTGTQRAWGTTGVHLDACELYYAYRPIKDDVFHRNPDNDRSPDLTPRCIWLGLLLIQHPITVGVQLVEQLGAQLV